MKTLEQYVKNKTGLEYYAMLKTKTEKELSDLWEDVDERAYMWFLEFSIPAKHTPPAYASGEPTCSGENGTIHTVGIEVAGRYFLRPAYLEKFDTFQYIKEIQARFAVEDSPWHTGKRRVGG